MVTQHFRWDFYGLSTDTKPTPEESEKVTNGSTYYCADTSKLYVWCKDNWYEKVVEGGGGTSDFNGLTNRPKYNGTDMTGETDIPVVKDVNEYTIKGAGTPTTSTEGTIGLLYEDTTNGKLYQCTAIDTTDPNAPVYTWSEVGGGSGPTVVQTTGTSTTDVMSQNAVTSMVFADPSTKEKVNIASTNTPIGEKTVVIGYATSGEQRYAVGIGYFARSNGDSSVSLGPFAKSFQASQISIGNTVNNSRTFYAEGSIAIGWQSQLENRGSIALGAFSGSTSIAQGEMNIGSRDTSYGYNNSNYRLISGVYDGQGLHDAATVAQGNTLATSAPTTSTEGVLGQLYTDTTNMHTYQCTAISGSTYTWTQRW